MVRNVILMRHGESEANALGLWQGAGSSPITAKGCRQARHAGERLAGRLFAIVESSDLQRCVETARAAGFEPVLRAKWREGDVGEWEGLPGDVVIARFGKEIERIHYDRDRPLGITGESPWQVADRGCEALEDLVERLADGETALVVTHGGLIGSLLWRLLDLPPDRRRLGALANTSFCELTFRRDGPAIRRYNDAAHLGSGTGWPARMRLGGAVLIDLIRHGAPNANLEHCEQTRLQYLHPSGKDQAGRLGDCIGQVDNVYSSSLGRAMDTAEIVFGRAASPVPALNEIDTGGWDDRAWPDVESAGSAGTSGGDGTGSGSARAGETWRAVQQRVSPFLSELGSIHPGQRVAAVSHGGVIRAYTGSVLGFGLEKARLLAPLDNTSVTRVVLPAGGKPVLATYNITAHLEDRSDLTARLTW